jgi:hypothetical protein
MVPRGWPGRRGGQCYHQHGQRLRGAGRLGHADAGQHQRGTAGSWPPTGALAPSNLPARSS